MGKTVVLRHTTHTLPLKYEHFYEGYAIARDGLLTLDERLLPYARSAYTRGYQLTKEGRQIKDMNEMDEYIRTGK